MPLKMRVISIRIWWMPIWRGVLWIIWLGLIYRLCCGVNCLDQNQQVGFNLLHYALYLIEDEIEKFKADEYWTISAIMHTPEGAPFEARLTTLSGNKLDKLDIKTEAAAKAAVKRIESKSMSVQKIERKQSRRNPYAPFITSTLQQAASRMLGFGAQQTMRTAQKLYEE